MFGIGAGELLVLLLIVLLLFGAKRLPELAKGLGSALREFRSAAKDVALEKTISGDNKPEDIQNET